MRTDDERAALFDTYQQQRRDARLNATLVGDFDRQLARALAALPTTRVMACPSRGETLANVVFETGLWAQHHGAIVLAPGCDGFLEQITDGHNGLLYPPSEVRLQRLEPPRGAQRLDRVGVPDGTRNEGPVRIGARWGRSTPKWQGLRIGHEEATKSSCRGQPYRPRVPVRGAVRSR
ncbi:glycosyltransferase [Kitasatospora sp. NPDC056783]|uniref:glycosyltransferase n=1 Tax=Kitasatospora sp. NPDC056783 TaxID=3345943 RepID=UPI0036B3F8B1